MSAKPDEIPAKRREAEAALRRGDRDRAVALLRAARAAAEELAADDRAMLEDYTAISLELADLAAQAEDYSAVVQVLAETQATCHRLGAPGGELWAVMNLLNVHLSRGDLKAARSYVNMVVPLFAQVDSQDEQVVPPPDRAQVHQLLTSLAERLYYELEDYEAARTAAEAAIQLLPDEPLGHYFLGLALLELERYDDAIPTWQRLVALRPDLPFNHVNLAAALGSAGRVEEAVEVMGRALELAPDKARYWCTRGQWNGLLGRHEAAVADYDKVLELAAAAPSEPPPATTPHSFAAYKQKMPLQDIADFAAMSRLRSLQELGRVDEAIQAAYQLVEERDEVTAQATRMFLGDLYESLGRRRDAINLYTQVLAEDSSHADAHCRRARLYLAENLLDEATEDLSAVADDDETAEDAIPVLTQLLRQAPGHAGARKTLGRAYLTAWLPAKAFEALTAALAVLPEDWELRYWRGLAGITHGDEPDEVETAWNSSFGQPRVADAVKDLAEAATRTADARPATALRWLAERVGAHQQLLKWLSAEIESSGSPIAEVLPELALVSKLVHAGNMGGDRRWQEAVDELVLTRAQLVDAGLRILAMQADLLLADNYLRLYQIQAALDHLAAAEEGLRLLGLPLDEAVRRRAEEREERDQKSGIPIRIIDFDHLELFTMVAGEVQWLLGYLRAQARARIGDPAGAVEMIGDSGGVERLLSELNDGEISPSSALGIGTMLRDAGRLDDALALTRQVERIADNDPLRITVHNFAATVLELIGDLDGAAEHSRAALALAQGSPEAVAGIAINLAQIQLLRDEPQQALDLADANPPPPGAQQPLFYGHHALRGMALFDLRDYAGAQRELTAALAIQDEARGRLRSYEDRMLWHAKQLTVHEHAVLAAALNSEWSTALDLVERFKARAFVDQLAAGQLPPAVEPDDLHEALDRVQARRRLLRRLSVSAQTGYVDHELLRRLAELGGDTDLIDQREDGSQRLVAERLATELTQEDKRAERLETEIQDAKLAAVESIVGTILSLDQIRDLLGRGHRAARRWRTGSKRSGG